MVVATRGLLSFTHIMLAMLFYQFVLRGVAIGHQKELRILAPTFTLRLASDVFFENRARNDMSSLIL